MSSAPSPRTIVAHRFNSDHYLPTPGEIIIVRLATDLHGPGSDLSTLRGLPTGANKHNYHHAVVASSTRAIDYLEFTVYPCPAYSTEDPIFHLSSTSWLLSQPDDFKSMHIPMPYETLPTAVTSGDSVVIPVPPPALPPLFPTPAAFGDPLEVGGWKDRRPSWVMAVPQVVPLRYTTRFKSFDPPVMLSADELLRLRTYSQMLAHPSGSISSNTLPPPGDNDVAPKGPGPTPTDNNVSSHCDLHKQQPEDTNSYGGNGVTGGSLAWRALFASDAVIQALTQLSNRDKHSAAFPTFDDSEDDSEDEDDSEEWADTMDPVTFARYYASTIPQFAKIVQDHNRESHAHLNRKITDWAGGVVLHS